MIPTPTPTPPPIQEDVRWLVTTAIAVVGVLLGLGNFFWALWKDRRRLTVEAFWEWGLNPPPPYKDVTVVVTNLQPKPITMNAYITYTNTDRYKIMFAERYKLEESDTKEGRVGIQEYQHVKAVYATDTYGKRWHVPKRQIKSIRSAAETNQPK